MFEVTFTMTEDDVQAILKVVNTYICKTSPVTIEEVRNNPELLAYLCDLDFKAFTMGDLQDFWNNDGWGDVEEYR